MFEAGFIARVDFVPLRAAAFLAGALFRALLDRGAFLTAAAFDVLFAAFFAGTGCCPRRAHWRMEATAATPKLAVVIGSTFAGTLLGACAAGLLLGREWSYNGPDLSIPVILTMYVLDATVVVVCALLALYLRYRSVPDIRRGILLVGLGLVVGGLVSLAPAVAFASGTGYSNERSAQEAEVVIVAACCLIGIAGGALTWVSTRRASA